MEYPKETHTEKKIEILNKNDTDVFYDASLHDFNDLHHFIELNINKTCLLKMKNKDRIEKVKIDNNSSRSLVYFMKRDRSHNFEYAEKIQILGSIDSPKFRRALTNLHFNNISDRLTSLTGSTIKFKLSNNSEHVGQIIDVYDDYITVTNNKIGEGNIKYINIQNITDFIFVS